MKEEFWIRITRYKLEYSNYIGLVHCSFVECWIRINRYTRKYLHVYMYTTMLNENQGIIYCWLIILLGMCRGRFIWVYISLCWVILSSKILLWKNCCSILWWKQVHNKSGWDMDGKICLKLKILHYSIDLSNCYLFSQMHWCFCLICICCFLVNKSKDFFNELN